MSIQPPAPGEPRRPSGPRDPGDAWVVAETGERYWGRFGAAGLLAVDPTRGVLLQHRVGWSHFGGTWGLPGGARHQGEGATDAALREAREEAGVPAGAVRPRFVSVFDVGIWTYTTVVAEVVVPFEPVIADPESLELAWVGLDEVEDYPLHPGFGAAWPSLQENLRTRPTLIVDVANVVGAVPDGWWRDRAGAADRMLRRLRHLVDAGVDAEALGLWGELWFPRIIAVVEGEARRAPMPEGLEVVRASQAGDDEIVEAAAAAAARGEAVTVITSDRELAARVGAVGAVSRGARWLLDSLPGEVSS
ncbi:8-oxo-dGTP pyrophosphatase MutT (NUDIX family) [Microbacterium sp. AK009]|uniref:NUDIX domain-containing protein n=1 Tax=Microbacterium sp. AK009 TaxID=2723068 RepID=UPI0015CCCC06|nr:NUDIX domain-containing protein [Microbacterium sp. AK009]NYF16367.1 8-oxo-dGTP pyrophosphatase MutT (NUDIX family) [Microbacterium sp. AK009]